MTFSRRLLDELISRLLRTSRCRVWRAPRTEGEGSRARIEATRCSRVSPADDRARPMPWQVDPTVTWSCTMSTHASRRRAVLRWRAHGLPRRRKLLVADACAWLGMSVDDVAASTCARAVRSLFPSAATIVEVVYPWLCERACRVARPHERRKGASKR